MVRAAIVLLAAGIGAAAVSTERRAAWPFQATVTDLQGRPVPFQVVTLGGTLVFKVGEKPPLGTPIVEYLVVGDTLRAMTPALYAMNPERGAILFFTQGEDSIQLVVGRNPFGATDRVSARGQRLSVRLVGPSAVIDSR